MRDFNLTRSARKTIALVVRGGVLDVRAPLRMPKADIDKFVASKEQWIEKQLARQQALAQKRKQFTVSYGDTVLYRGKPCPIVERAGRQAGFDDALSLFYMPPDLPPQRIKATVVQSYKQLAKRHLTQRVLHFQALMGVRVTALKINSAKTRWGSMSAKQSVNFSWRLIMAEDDVIDAVVVHELAHIKQMNHSDRFWAEVEKILPDYKKRDLRLKAFSRMIGEQNWEDD